MTDEDRREVAERVRGRRQSEYGTKAAAYQAAGVNAATWDRVEQGQTVREDRLRAVLRTLWPDTGGDWAVVLGKEVTWNTLDLTIDDLRQRSSDHEHRLAALEEEVRRLRQLGGHDDQAQEPRTQEGSPEHGSAGRRPGGEGTPMTQDDVALAADRGPKLKQEMFRQWDEHDAVDDPGPESGA